ncbi:hypothetical protein [Pelagimonas varians]|uniref:hypothetical protein n=1 Tax=Pelagimonas varians TaxID=696760 RepID=UPI000D861286|nr:hypothetical protein [Pelagimonas varians]PYG26316.1 hypothetical protein C8N36_12522 [Pelagimonas varians]
MMGSLQEAQQLLVVLPEGENTSRDIFQFLEEALPDCKMTRHDDFLLAAKVEPATTVIALMFAPIDCLAVKLAAGQAPDIALNEWRSHAEDILKVFRKDRRRIAVLDFGAVVAAPQEALNFLTERLGLNQKIKSPEAASLTWTAPSAHWRILASALVEAGAADLVDELETMLPASQKIRRFSLSAIEQAIEGHNTDQATIGRQQTEIDELRDKIKMSDQAQRAHQAVQAERNSLRGVLRDLFDQLETVSQEKQMLTVSRKGLQQDAELHREQQNYRESVLGAVLLDRMNAAEDAAGSLRAERDRQSEELASVYASRSWKVTGPMRATRRRIDKT